MALGAAREAWKLADGTDTRFTVADIYNERWSWYDGTMFEQLRRTSTRLRHPAVYAKTRLLYKHVEGVVDFYANTVYQGELSTDGKPLPDGTLGAIPVDPQTGDPEADTRLRTAIAESWSLTNWRQQMSLRPMFGAALGDVLTELVDDVERGVVYPAIVWPGHVSEIELDFVGNVKRYVLEFDVVEKDRFGNNLLTYRFRKEVDKDAFRYFKDDKPFDLHGEGAVVPNPYGFVPAIWDRHKIGWGVRGTSAIDGTRQALTEVNSLLSHGMDFQRKAFDAPIVITGAQSPADAARSRVMELGQRMLGRGEDGTMAPPMQETTTWIPAQPGATIQQAQFDIGQTMSQVEVMLQGIREENPEASFYHELRKMSQVTGPGVERALGDAVSRCRRARAGYDTGTVKLFQMLIAMSGFRVRTGAWTAVPKKRRAAFSPFDLTSFGEGLLDFGILDRPVVLPTEQERLALIAQREGLRTRQGLIEAGYSAEVPEESGVSEVDRLLAERGIADTRVVVSAPVAEEPVADEPVVDQVEPVVKVVA